MICITSDPGLSVLMSLQVSANFVHCSRFSPLQRPLSFFMSVWCSVECCVSFCVFGVVRIINNLNSSFFLKFSLGRCRWGRCNGAIAQGCDCVLVELSVIFHCAFFLPHIFTISVIALTTKISLFVYAKLIIDRLLYQHCR